MRGSLASLFYFAATKLTRVKEKKLRILSVKHTAVLSPKRRNFASMTVKVRADLRVLAFLLPLLRRLAGK